MNKARFTNLALEVAREMRCEFPADEWDNSGEEHSEESYTFYKSELIEFATKFLSAYLAEESKEAVAWIHATDTRAVIRNLGGMMDRSNWLPTFLHPQEVPEGYALVPIEPTKAMQKAALKTEADDVFGVAIQKAHYARPCKPRQS